MARRKLMPVDDLRQRINEMLLTDIRPTCKAALCQLLEDILHDTGNYHGFGWPKLTATEAKNGSLGDSEYGSRKYYKGG